MSVVLTEKNILAICGRTYLERGRAYRAGGRILDLRWDDDEELLYSSVKGSGSNVYDQAVRFYPHRSRRPFKGECSCPVEFNCKHVAAVLLEWISRQNAFQQPAALPAKRRRSDLALWQKEIRQLLPPPAAPVQAGVNVLIYLLKPQTYRDNTKIFLHIYKSRRLKRGGWSRPTSYNLQQFAYYHYYRPDWVTTLDMEVIELAKHGLEGASTPSIAGDVGILLLKRLLASGRCFFESEENPPLAPGPPRQADFAWREEAGGGRRLRIGLEGVEGSWTAMPTDPPWYIDTQRHQCGPIEQPLDSRLFQALRHLPSLEASELDSFSRFLFPLLPPESLPLPSELKIETWNRPPSPVLLLRGEQGLKGSAIHIARVCFAYGPLRLPPWNESGEKEQLHQHGGRDWLVRRDPDFEEECLRRLTAFGFAPAAVAGAGEPGEWDVLFTGETVAASAARWRDFLEQLPQLAGEGWMIETAESFRLRFTTAEQLTARIDEAEGGWFDIGLDVECGERRLPLLPLLTAWLERGGAAQGLLLPLGDGAWLEIPQTVLQPVLDTLLELYRRPALNEAGQLRLPRQQAPCLEELDRRLGGEGQRLAWQGGERVRLLAEKLRNFSGIVAVPPPSGLRAELRPYQGQGLSWLQFLREYGFGGILADDMGLGKTVQALAYLLSEKEAGRLENPALVVAPTSVLGNWRREAARFAPDLKVLVLHGPDRAGHFETLACYDLIITSYALLHRDAAVLRRHLFHSVILDEAQAIKNARSKGAQTACLLRAVNRLCLTGTPLENHLGELWSLFHFLMPGFLGHESDFNHLFRQPIEKRGDVQRQQELTRRIAPFILRRDKGQVATELPPKTDISQSVELAGPQRRLYETIRAAMAEKVGTLLRQKGLARSHIEVLDALLKLRQACCDPRLVKLESARKVRQSAKLELLLEMLEELLEEGRRILLFSQFTSMLALIEEELQIRRLKYVKLTGQTRKRDEVIAAFQNGEAPLFLISLKAGGVGLNLTAADTVIHYDPWWNPAVERQATDRAHRIGQDKPVFVYKLVAADTVEEKILQLQERKQALADDIYRKAGAGEEFSAFDAAEILSLFAP
ncbi:DEAD/DEAH box helicase [Desulfuromonas sp. TF]|uniref:DEAD/DEAH box helicase n=1 Tax=Desulfuromonas sp. TF TaxID=1232410 RepID=UPI0012DD3009|nr:DEAD/DEAH box helicase [Desulfuromonas sp. TF]